MVWIGWRWGVGACALALGCGSNGGDDGATSVADGTDDASAADDDDDDDGPTDPSADDDDDGPTDPSADDDDDDTSADDDPSATSEGSDDATGSTTGEEMYCGIQEDVGDAPWFELSHYGDPVVDGSVLSLECGGQGSWMFFLSTEIGGWTPPEEEVFLSVTVDVPGREGPKGHFFHNTSYGVYVGCEEFDGGGAPVGLAIIPPDGITDVTVLNGLSGTIHVELLAEGSPTLDAEIELAVPAEIDPEGCNPFG